MTAAHRISATLIAIPISPSSLILRGYHAVGITAPVNVDVIAVPTILNLNQGWCFALRCRHSKLKGEEGSRSTDEWHHDLLSDSSLVGPIAGETGTSPRSHLALNTGGAMNAR
jgi:hypothetical protein